MASLSSSCLCFAQPFKSIANANANVNVTLYTPSINIVSSSSSSRSHYLLSTSSLLASQIHCKGNLKQRRVSVRCEQSSKGSTGVDVWVGRAAMVGFVAAVSVEIATGKGLLQNIGLTTPLPTVALALTLAVGAWLVFSIFQSGSES